MIKESSEVNNELSIEMINKQLQILEDNNKTEVQFYGVNDFLDKCIENLIENPKLLSRYLKAFITQPIDKEWEFDISNRNVLLSVYRINIDEPCEEWDKLMKELPNLKRTIPNSIFYQIINFCIHQNSKSIKEIIKILLDELLIDSTGDCIICLSYLLKKAKPIAKKTFVPYSPDIYSDRETVGFYCKPYQVIKYEEPSIFPNDGFDYVRNSVINFLCEEGMIHKVFQKFVTINPETTETNGRKKPDLNFLPIWKRFTQILKDKMIPLMKELIHYLDQAPITVKCACKAFTGFSRGLKHWAENDKEVAIKEILIPTITKILSLKQNDEFQPGIFAFEIVADLNYHRFNWLNEILIKMLEESNGNSLSNALKVAGGIFTEYDISFQNEYISILKNVILPKFDDLSQHMPSTISALAEFVVARNSALSSPNVDSSILDVIFKLIFDKNFGKNDELLAIFVSQLMNMIEFCQKFMPYIAERFDKFLLMDSNISTRFQELTSNSVQKTAVLMWGLDCEQFKLILKKIKETMPLITWFTKLNVIEFIQISVFSSVFLFTKEIYEEILFEVLPLFVKEENGDIINGLLDTFVQVISILYVDGYDKLADETIEKLRQKENNQFAIYSACALLSIVRCWKDVPKWLPIMFEELEKLFYSKNKLSGIIVGAVKEFWSRHEYVKLPEIEDFKYSFSLGYFA
ncbi:proteasome activator complex subunit 4B-like [Histomonas meleagridis]|uniref:proteasome activator complex subunit 4B-like n=1 Tax=Histomonas meleagridis TaxID=135588 RepID=UPI003559C3E4|nr:proteasome activator complex subunit 4B-like [Histomonas meleagridis]KAH0798918.1 proteasome activator complex subunit 4B-like [Histomonas meleagridis]